MGFSPWKDRPKTTLRRVATLDPARSADWQSAVSRIGNPQTTRTTQVPARKSANFPAHRLTLRICGLTADHSPSPGGEGRGEGGRSLLPQGLESMPALINPQTG